MKHAKKNNLKGVQTYIPEADHNRWVKHFEKMKPLYQSMSHMLEVAVEYNIEADNYDPNKWVGKIGPMKLRK